MPKAADLTAGSDSVITRSPPGRTVRVTVDSSPACRPVWSLMSCAAPGCAPWCDGGRHRDPRRCRRRGHGRRQGPAVIVTTTQVLARGLALDHLDGDERQLSAVVDLADLDLDLLA